MISSKLTRNLSPEERKQMEKNLKHFRELLNKMSDVLRDELKLLDKEAVAPPKNVENWAWQQAYLRGQQAAYFRLINLLESDQ